MAVAEGREEKLDMVEVRENDQPREGRSLPRILTAWMRLVTKHVPGVLSAFVFRLIRTEYSKNFILQ